MQTCKHGLSEPNMFLMELYRKRLGRFIQELSRNDSLHRFVEDPVHFDYRFFDETWWPLFCFSDIGMEAMKYGKDSVAAAFDRLQGAEREKAEYYLGMYCEKEETYDTTDIYHIPDYIDNPKV